MKIKQPVAFAPAHVISPPSIPRNAENEAPNKNQGGNLPPVFSSKPASKKRKAATKKAPKPGAVGVLRSSRVPFHTNIADPPRPNWSKVKVDLEVRAEGWQSKGQGWT